jgi:hypothetical protein
MNVDAKSGAKEISFSAIITRADGTVEDLGVISYYNNNPFKRWIWKIKQFFKGK